MAELTSKQRAFLRKLAHHEKAIAHVGSDGVTESVVQSIEEAFNRRELMKVKVLESAPDDVRTSASRIADALEDVHVAQTIGRTIVLYRRHPENPEIKLPRAGR